MKERKMNYTFSASNHKLLIIVPFIFLSIILQGQKVHTKEIKETFNNEVTIFNIITDNIDIKFKENLEYNWYNEFTGNQTSKGTSGGKLLHGRYSNFDERGRLRGQRFYKFGLQDSTSILWDENGEVIEKYVFKNGVLKYEKIKYGNGKIVEYFNFYKDTFDSKEYTENNSLQSEAKLVSRDPRIHEVKEYFPKINKLKSHYYIHYEYNYGQYKEFTENGSLLKSGNYDKKYKLGHKIGLWLVFDEKLNKMDSIRYRLSENILDAKGNKEVGSLIFNKELNEWIKDGEWYRVNNKGIIDYESKINYDSFGTNIDTYASETTYGNNTSNTIKLVKTASGLLEVPVILNGVLKINFILDSGASEVSLSPDVALTLIRTGTITDSDFLPDQTFKFADGSTAKSKRFLIKKLNIGNQTLTNIEASISNSIEAPMLMGQNVMNKLGSITIDYENQLLIIKTK
jgi:aspartyl protease family protein